MFLETGAVLSLAAQCAPAVAPHTIAAIVDAESSNYVFAINVNGVASQPRRPRNEAEAIATARSYVARGYSVDLGLGQINSRNMGWLGLTWDTVFKQCSNIEAAGRVLLSNFRSAKTGRTPQEALRVALSMYNTGSQSRGFRNGYVARVENAGRRVSGRPATAIPTVIVGDQPASAAMSDTGAGRVPVELAEIAAENMEAAPPPAPPAWDVFGRAQHARIGSEGEDRSYRMFRIWKIKAESRLDALLARLKPSPLMARALPLSLLASLLVAEPAFAQANFEGLADNILGLLSNGLLRTLAIIAIIVVGLLWFLGRASVQMLVTVVVGVVIVFSAPWIVDTITG